MARSFDDFSAGAQAGILVVIAVVLAAVTLSYFALPESRELDNL